MKKISLVLLVSLLCLALTSCLNLNFGGNQGGEGENEEKENLIYNTESEIYFVYDPETIPEQTVNKITNELSYNNVLIRPRRYDSAPEKHEIILGNVGRDASNEAYAQLERIDKNTERDLRFCIYSTGSSLAIAYDTDLEGYCLGAAVDYFIGNYVKEELVLEKGVAHKESFNLYDYLGALDEEYYQERWDKIRSLAGTYGNDLVSALQSLYSLYDGEKLVRWISNLYDSNICVCYGLYGLTECQKDNPDAPEYCKFCGTGGFYYSNSARDNYGFLPDAESTNQALGFISDCGLAAGVGGNYVSVVPDWMAEQLIGFIYNLQDPGGFFFHPQWGKNIGDSRRSRDYNWCLNILKAYKVTPKYQTIGDLPVEDSASGFLPSRLGSSSVSAVSKVVSMESQTDIPPQLASLEAFKAYLISQDVPNKSYVAGNNFSSQSSQIRARGQEYCDMLIDHLNECQYDNGTWHHTINYYAINGVMKISGVYSGMKAVIPNADLACKAAFAAVSSDQETGGIVDLWNTWEAVSRVLSNIKNYGDGEEAVAELREEILASAAPAIVASRNKLSAYLKTDGSFSYKKTSSSATSQGVPVAISGTNEGDVNATVIGSTYMISSIFSCLGMGAYKVTIARSKERAIFLDIINELSPVNKGETDTGAASPFDFDYETVGEETTELNFGSGAECLIVSDERGSGNVLRYTGAHNGERNNFLTVSNQGASVGAGCQVFEGELCFAENIPSDDSFRLEFGNEGDSNNAYRITFRKSADGIQLWESSSATSKNNYARYLGVSAQVGEWFKLRVEYYKGDEASVRIKVYFNDKLCAVSDNYYDGSGIKLDGVGTPSSNLKLTRFYSLNGKRVVVLIDNVVSYASRDQYVKEALHEDYAKNPYAINVDDVREENIVYDFEDGEVPERLTVVKGEKGAAEIRSLDGKKLLLLANGASVYIPVVKLSRDANCSVFEAEIPLNETKVGDVAKISFSEADAANRALVSLTLSVAEEGGLKYLNVKDESGKKINAQDVLADKTVKIRIDFYEAEKVALVYADDKPIGLTATVGSKLVRFEKAIVTSLSGSAIMIDATSADRTAKDYASATEPPYPGKIYGFDKGLDGITVSGSGIAVQGSGSSANLRFEVSVSKKGTLTVPATERDTLLSYTELGFDVKFTDSSKNGATHKIAITDASGEIVFSVIIKLNNGKAELYESTALGTHKAPVADFTAAEGANLRFEYYEIDGICKIYVDGKYKVSTSLVYSAENKKLTPAFATISAQQTSSTVVIDNLVLDRSNKLYTAEKATNPESEAEVITFDSSSGESFSNKISTSIGSAAPKPSVVEVEKNGQADKALKFETQNTTVSMDVVGVALTKQVTGAKSFVFDLDLMIDSTSVFQIWFSNSSGSGMQLCLTVKGDKVCSYHGNAGGTNGKNLIDLGVAKNEWFNLKVENYFYDGKMYGKVYINGVHAYTAVYYADASGIVADTFLAGKNDVAYSSVVTTNNEKMIGSLTKVEFRATKSAEGIVYLDNVSFYGSTQDYK